MSLLSHSELSTCSMNLAASHPGAWRAFPGFQSPMILLRNLPSLQLESS